MKPFWGWAQAIRAAGLEYADLNVSLLEKIPCPFCGREFASLGAHLFRAHEASKEDCQSEDHDECMYSEALRAHVTSSLKRQDSWILHWEPIWSPEYVLDRTHELHSRGISVNVAHICEKEEMLLHFGAKYFGSWDSVLRKIGLEPNKVRLYDETIRFSKADITSEFKKRLAKGLPLNTSAVYTSDVRLYSAARRRFGTYLKALKAAGISPRKVQLLPPRHIYNEADRTKLLEAIRQVAQLPEEQRGPAIRMLRVKYRKVVLRLFQTSWPAAAKAAGVSFRSIHTQDHRDLSSREKVLEVLKARLKTGKSVERMVLHRKDVRLWKAVHKYYPGATEYYRRLEITAPPGTPSRYSTKESVLCEIRRRQRIGLPLKNITNGNPPVRDIALSKTARKYFKSWRRAVSFALK
jgi:hypothetical protein